MLAKLTDRFIFLDQVTQGSEDSLIKWFSVKEPNARYLDLEHWDGWYRRYNISKQRLELPFFDELKLCCDKNNIPLEIIDTREAPRYPAPQEQQITSTFLDDIKLEDYQVNALRACCKKEIGIISAVTGAGKSELICGLVKMFRCPTIIITEQIIVLEQIVQRLRVRKVVHRDDIGMFCYGHMPDGNSVMVGSIQSVSSPKKPNRDEIKLSGKNLLSRTMKWINFRRSIVERDPNKLWCDCGKSFENKINYENHVSKCDEKKVDHLSRSLPKALVDKLVKDESFLDKIDGKYMQLLVDYHKELEWNRRKKWYSTRIKKSKAIQDLIRKCDLLIVDECDLSSGNNYSKLFKSYFTGRRRYGFSGTPYDPSEPVKNLLLKENLGNIIFEAERKDVEKVGRIIPIKYYMFAVGADGNKNDSRAYDIAMKEDIIENVDFHKLVAGIVKTYPKDGTLILVNTAPIEPLGYALEELIPNSKFIFGKTRKVVRRKYIDLFEKRELTCLIGSLIFKRGLDLKGGVENLIIIGGGGKSSEYNQKIGRAVRLNDSGIARVFGFLFLNNKYLYRHSRNNLKTVVGLGYPSTVIIGRKIINGEKFVKSRFRIPK